MAGKTDILSLPPVEMRDRLASGALRASEVAEACLAAVQEREDTVQAFAWLDPDHVRQQAKALDIYRSTGRALGPLHGMPVALKDVIDTARIPTENGTVLDAGRVPTEDAALVQSLKAAGAIIFGKTATAELAFLSPCKTRNPNDPDRTPGGSSSGSAAAVAAGMVPLAVGTQTGGSVIRPASFCGVVGYKPTFGSIPRRGVLAQAPSLDTIGVFARDVDGAAMIAEALYGHDPLDRATRPAPHPRLLDTARQSAPVAPTFAFIRTPHWDRAEPSMQAAMEELAALLGEQCFEGVLPGAFADAPAIRQQINVAELAKCYFSYGRRGRDRLSPELTAAMEAGEALPARDYIAALDWSDVLNAGLEQYFQRCDAILTPAATGPAPSGLASTGDPIFNGTWTLCGTPAVTLPLFTDENGLPMGVQLVGRRGDDARLLRTARWLSDFVKAS